MTFTKGNLEEGRSSENKTTLIANHEALFVEFLLSLMVTTCTVVYPSGHSCFNKDTFRLNYGSDCIIIIAMMRMVNIILPFSDYPVYSKQTPLSFRPT